MNGLFNIVGNLKARIIRKAKNRGRGVNIRMKTEQFYSCLRSVLFCDLLSKHQQKTVLYPWKPDTFMHFFLSNKCQRKNSKRGMA